MFKKIALLFLISATIGSVMNVVEAADYNKPRVFLASVSNIDKAELNDVKNDVTKLSETFSSKYYEYKVDRFDNSGKSGDYKKNEKTEKEAFINKFRESADDAAGAPAFIAYLTGHMENIDGQLYFLLSNYDYNNLDSSACSASEIKDIMNDCKAPAKLLILDGCYSGSEIWGDDVTFATITSSETGQQSCVWKKKKQSLFTFWLNYGLHGFADQDNDDKLTIDELFDFVKTEVSETASSINSDKQQEPQKFNFESFNFDFEPGQRSINECINEMVELSCVYFARKCFEDKTTDCVVGIADFVAKQSSLGGNLPHKIAEQFGEKWSKAVNSVKDLFNPGFKVSVLDSYRVQEELEENNIQLDALSTSKAAIAFKDACVENVLIDANKNVPVFIAGSFELLKDGKVRLNVRCVNPNNGDMFGKISCVAFGTLEYFINAGVNVDFDNPEGPSTGQSAQQLEQQAVAAVNNAIDVLDEEAEPARTPHPLETHKDDFTVELRSRPEGSNEAYKAVPITFENGNAYATFKKGSEYEIVVRNNRKISTTESEVFEGLNFKVTVDGRQIISTEPRPTDSLGRYIASKTSDWKYSDVKNVVGYALRSGEQYKIDGFVKMNQNDKQGKKILNSGETRYFVVNKSFSFNRDTYTTQNGILSFMIEDALLSKTPKVRGERGEDEPTPHTDFGKQKTNNIGAYYLSNATPLCTFNIFYSVEE